jgi:hypothetical protein
MAPNQNEFSVFDLIWEEIIICLVLPKKSCHYAPYIFAMIKEVIGVAILIDKGHQVYKSKKVQELLIQTSSAVSRLIFNFV